MGFLKKLALLLLVTTTSIQAEEVSYQHSIAMDVPSLLENADALHVMTHTSKFSIIPVSHHNPAYIVTPQVPGADPISSLVAAFIATSIINNQNSRENDATAKFTGDLGAILQTIDISQEFSLALQKKLSEQLTNTQFEFENVTSRNTLNQAGLLVRIKQNYILTFENRLYFDNKLQSLCFETSPRLWLKDKANPIYLSEIKYISHQLISEDKSFLKASWTQNNGERLKQSIKDGIQASVDMFMQDFLSQGWKTGSESVAREISFIDTHSGKTTKNKIFPLAETSDRIAGRMFAHDAAQLISIPKSQIIGQTIP